MCKYYLDLHVWLEDFILVCPDPSLTAGAGGLVLALISTQMLSACCAGLSEGVSAFSVAASVQYLEKLPDQTRLEDNLSVF